MADDISKGALNSFQEQTTQLQINAAALNKTLDDLQQKQRDMAGSWQKYTQEFADGNKAIQDTETALKAANKQIGENAEVLKIAKGSLQQNKALLDDLMARYDAMLFVVCCPNVFDFGPICGLFKSKICPSSLQFDKQFIIFTNYISNIMKKLILITIIICTALAGRAQTTKPIDGFLGIKFGSTAAQVIDQLTAKGVTYRKDKSNQTTLIFTNVTLGTHKSFTFFVELINNQAYQGQFVFKPELEAKSIENYNIIVSDVTDAYGSGKSQKTFKQPYQEGDGYEITAIITGKAIYGTLWEDNANKNSIYAEIDTKGYTRLTYQDSKLTDSAINQQKEKNKSDF